MIPPFGELILIPAISNPLPDTLSFWWSRLFVDEEVKIYTAQILKL